ncbi:MAG: heavy-metal-associated domain-containing protein, partial [Prevotellaceae bacterium]|nr:heavy-metal-associated domain-containing protein [Prevotellaceae bacterium]
KCKAKIEKNISWEKGVKDLTVNLEKKTVAITYDPQKSTAEKLKEAIEKLGYTAEKHPDPPKKTDAPE